MPAIHLVKNDPTLPSIKPIEPGSDIWQSGYWTAAKETADALKGGKIYFHERQAEPSYFGGIITVAKRMEDGEHVGGVVFTFRSDQTCKGVSTSRDGWSQEMKIILDEEPSMNTKLDSLQCGENLPRMIEALLKDGNEVVVKNFSWSMEGELCANLGKQHGFNLLLKLREGECHFLKRQERRT